MEIQSTLNSQSNLEKEKMELQESGSLTSNYRKKKKLQLSEQYGVGTKTEILAFPQALGERRPRAKIENKNKFLGNT